MSFPREAFLKNLSNNDFYIETLKARWLDQPGLTVDALDNLLYHEAIYRIKKGSTKRNVMIDDLEYFYRVHLSSIMKEEDLSGLKYFCAIVAGWIFEDDKKIEVGVLASKFKNLVSDIFTIQFSNYEKMES